MARKSNNWSRKVPNAVAIARSGGRKKYNAMRQFEASLRQIKVAQMMNTNGWRKGTQRQIARQLGVSDSTISRDVKVILEGLKLSSN